MATAAERFAALRARPRARRRPGRGGRGGEAPPARHARLRPRRGRALGHRRARGARRWPSSAAPSAATGDRPRRGLPAPNAAFANAMLCHGLDFDDTHSDSVCHVSAVVAPAALAAGEARGATARELLAAIVAGNEIVTRIGMAASGAFHARGFHPTAICGIFGGDGRRRRGSAASTRDDDERARASPGGWRRALRLPRRRRRRRSRSIRPGPRTARVLAARLAALGAEGPPSVLEGRFGLYHAFLGGAEARDRPREPARRPRLALGDAADRLQALPGLPLHARLARRDAPLVEVGVDPDEIDEIVVTVPRRASRSCSSRREPRGAPRSDYEAKFSLQYSTAAMLVHGRSASRLHRRGDRRPAGARGRDARCATRRATSRPTRRRSRAACGSRLKDGRTLEAELPVPAGRPGEPAQTRRGRREVPRQRRARAPDARARGARGGGARRSRSTTTCAAAFGARSRPRR